VRAVPYRIEPNGDLFSGPRAHRAIRPESLELRLGHLHIAVLVRFCLHNALSTLAPQSNVKGNIDDLPLLPALSPRCPHCCPYPGTSTVCRPPAFALLCRDSIRGDPLATVVTGKRCRHCRYPRARSAPSHLPPLPRRRRGSTRQEARELECFGQKPRRLLLVDHPWSSSAIGLTCYPTVQKRK